jgi:hypothetical protein
LASQIVEPSARTATGGSGSVVRLKTRPDIVVALEALGKVTAAW